MKYQLRAEIGVAKGRGVIDGFLHGVLASDLSVSSSGGVSALRIPRSGSDAMRVVRVDPAFPWSLRGSGELLVALGMHYMVNAVHVAREAQRYARIFLHDATMRVRVDEAFQRCKRGLDHA